MDKDSLISDEYDTPAVIQAAELGRKLAVATATPRRGSYQDAGEFVILRDAAGNERMEAVDFRAPAPGRRTGKVELHDAESFLAYWAEQQEGGHIYASMKPVKFTAVLNDHVKEKAGHRDHRAEFTVTHSPEWNTWTGRSGRDKAFASNEELALFFQDNLPDIVHPSAADMLKIATSFRVQQDVAFTVVQRLQDGNMSLGYSNNVSATAGEPDAAITIPETFRIDIPVFAGLKAPLYSVQARFRYRMQERKAVLWYELVRPAKVIEQAFADLVAQIDKDANTKILFGTPG